MSAPVPYQAAPTGRTAIPLPRSAQASVWLAVIGLASGLPASLAVAAGWENAGFALPPIIAVLLVTSAVFLHRAVRPLLLVLTASVTGLWLITVALELAEPLLLGWPTAARVLAVNGAKVLPLALTAIVLLRYRPGRHEMALRVGQWRADSGLRVAGYRIDWRLIGTTVGFVVCCGTIATGVEAFNVAGLSEALLWLPVYTAAAVVNATAEEFLFRHAINAVAGPLMGRTALIALTSAYFGVTHINGTPSGLAGILLSGPFGVVLALAIDHTRGFCWNWTLHFIADMAIFFTLIAANS
ncbi:CAAX protease self-immunity [Actinopolyspora mzabensis]|uniref:CAAX protease self-immunity n=1 Tax=Actinopolyspora mzabensis TaxID=995066 RepID=A0A1G9DGP6_ACTMZ|nr:CPBP family intramembrane glutamic endopeptidase [Actinopolyspora mzabensis]SDK63046.1 CAAX protease self-immunity [Actinopolyspora mzabensis]